MKTPPLSPFRDPGLTDHDDPYELLRDVGVRFDTSMADLHRACQQAQRRGALSPARSRAWATLRSVEKRLLLDLLFVNPRGDGAGEPSDEDVADPPAVRASELPDAPVALLVSAVGRVMLDASTTSASGQPATTHLWERLRASIPLLEPAAPLAEPACFLTEE